MSAGKVAHLEIRDTSQLGESSKFALLENITDEDDKLAGIATLKQQIKDLPSPTLRRNWALKHL